MKDTEIISSFQNGKREKGLKILYKEFPKVKANIIASGGTAELAQEIFNDSLLLLIEKVEKPDFRLTSSLSTFLFGIARFLWMNELKKKNRSVEVEWSGATIVTAEDVGYDDETEQKLFKVEKILNAIPQKCRQILELFYHKQFSMKTIAQKLGLSNVNSAKTQKYKCLERAIKLSKTV